MKKLEELGVSPTPWRICDERCLDGSIVGVESSDKELDLVAGDAVITEANARLIAAAPQLYKWLAFAVEQYKCETRSCDNCPNGKCWIVDATAALAKASGESEVK